MHRTRARLLALLALLGLLAGLLAGCTDSEAESAPEPTTAASAPTPTESSTPASSPTPERETVREFLERWAEVDKRMQNTGDVDEYRSLSAGCHACDDFADRVEGIYEAGGSIHTEGWTVDSVEEVDGTGKAPTVTYVRTAGSTSYTESEGGDSQQLEGGRSRLKADLKAKGPSWTITRLVERPL